MSSRPLLIDVPGAGRRLEARLSHDGAALTRPLAIVAPPHPVYGGTLGNPVVRALEQALRASELATLAFNFQGTGESDGEPSEDLDLARMDYLAAADALPNAELAVFSGYSFGSVTALAAAVERKAPRVLMVGPALGLLDLTLLPRFEGRLQVILGTEDEYMPVAAARDLFGSRPNTQLELLQGIDHWFLGSAITELSAGLTRLLAR